MLLEFAGRLIRTIALLLAATVFLGMPASPGAASETPAPSAEPVASSTPEPTAAPTPYTGSPNADSDLTALASRAEAAARDSMRIDLAPFIERLSQTDLRYYENVAASRLIFCDMAEAFNGAARRAAEAGGAEILGALPDCRVQLPERTLGWKQTAALYRAFRERTAEVLAEALVVGARLTKTGGAFSVEFALHDEILERGTREEMMTGRNTLFYLNTVYDDAGVFLPESPVYPLTEEYLATIAHPLQSGAGGHVIKDGWYNPRANKTRVHTGTDIIAPERTEIHSCTDGVVRFIGYGETPGYYVIVLDPYGFEYHYYHMVELTTLVREGDILRQGDAVGLVGNTGNSDANHLHLAVVTPDGAYINPYDMFLAAGITPIRPRG